MAPLLRRLRDCALLQRHTRQCQQPAGCSGASIHRDQRLSEHHAFEVRGRSDGHGVADLPEDVLGLGAACRCRRRTLPGPESVPVKRMQ